MKGLTLIEIIIYMAILGLVSIAFMTMSINIISLNNKSVSQQELSSTLRLISDKLSYEIKNAKSIASTTASSVTLNFQAASRNQTIFDLNNGNIRMGYGVGGSCPASSPCQLNSNLVNISSFVITNLSSGDSKTENIKYSITGNFKNSSGRAEFDATQTINGSQEVRSP